MQRPIFVVIQNKHQLISLPLTAGLVQLELVAELAFQDCGEEGGAEREVRAIENKGCFREVEIGFVGTERDER